MHNEKRTLRKEVRENLAKIEASYLRNKSLELSNKIAEWLSGRPEVQKVALYAALPSEVNLQPLTDLLPKVEWHYPVVTRTEMSFHLVSNVSTLTEGFSNILEPNPQVHPPVIEDTLDLILCPGLAFSPNGHRLGRGGGFYDRFLARMKDKPVMGVCLEEQLHDILPYESHDVKMTHIATPRGVAKVIPQDQNVT